MPHNSDSAPESLLPAQPIPAGAEEFSKQVRVLLDGKPKDEATVAKALEGMDAMLDKIAAGLYSMASMLVGEGEDSIRLVETAIARAELGVCGDAKLARQNSRKALCTAAIEILATRDEASLAAPEGVEYPATCIEDDDLSSAGISSEELESMLAGPSRGRVRDWLASLPTELRTVFVIRAVAGFTAVDTAAMLAAQGGPHAAGWTADAVREVSRQGLCSLASQLIHATAAH